MFLPNFASAAFPRSSSPVKSVPMKGVPYRSVLGRHQGSTKGEANLEGPPEVPSWRS